jgi:hypothetical protein
MKKATEETACADAKKDAVHRESASLRDRNLAARVGQPVFALMGLAAQERSRAANTRVGLTTSAIKATIAGWKEEDHENVKQLGRNPRG